MEGLEKILNRIVSDSQAKVDELIANANVEAKGISDDMKKKVDIKCEEILSQISSDKKNIEERTEASKEHKSMQMKLVVKREVIDETLKFAKEKINNLSDKDYENLLMKVFDKYLQNGCAYDTVKICFGERDLKKLSKDVIDSFIKKASEKGLKMTLSDTPVRINNGFILDFGDVLENCSFDAMIEQNKDKFEDIAKKILF